MDQPLVSIIVPTRDCADMLVRCLSSIRNQTYSNTEIVVVDGNSTDNTREVASEYTDKVFVYPEKGDYRCAQRNLGVANSGGQYVLIIDSDMELSEKVIESCIVKMKVSEDVAGIVIPEESFGQGFWAQCKKLERSFYIGVDWMEAARFFRKDIYREVGGYDEHMISGEDWDLSQRVAKIGKISRVDEFILHNEGRISLWRSVRKKFYYAQKFSQYVEKNSGDDHMSRQIGILGRYWLFLSRPSKLLKNPILGIGMLWMKTCEFGFGGLGYCLMKITR